MRLTLALLALLAVFTAGCINPDAWAAQLDPNPVSIISCDAEHACPSGFGCVQFDNQTVPLCARADPCSYHKCPSGESCSLVENTNPLQTRCA